MQNQDAELADLARRFEERLALSLKEAWFFDPFLPKELLESIKKNGVLTTAKDEIRKQTRIWTGKQPETAGEGWEGIGSKLEDAGAYFLMLRNRGLLDLSVEVLVTTAALVPLFTEEDCAISRARLERYGWIETDSSSTRSSVTNVHTSEDSEYLLRFLPFVVKFPLRECSEFRQFADSFADFRPRPRFVAFSRHHLRSCEQCRTAYPGIVESIDGFDSVAFETLSKLLKNWARTFDLRDEFLDDLLIDLPDPSEFEDDEDVAEGLEIQRQVERDDWIRRLWRRSAILGIHVGYYLERYEYSHAPWAGSRLWGQWRREPQDS